MSQTPRPERAPEVHRERARPRAEAAPRAWPSDPARALRRRTLARLRWLTIAGQTLSIAAAQTFLGLDLPLAACAGAIAIAVFYNAVASLASDQGQRLTDRDALLTLLFDLLQLSALLFLTGGLGNPFALLLLLPTTVAATILSLGATIALGVVTIVAAAALAALARPLAFPDGALLEPHPVHLVGLWVAIVVGVGFQAAYARLVATEAHNMSLALAATRSALEREQRISAIGALAASTAHELGTPLATIKLTAAELKRELADRPELREDAELIADQAKRCREILERLSAVRAPEDSHTRTAPISAVLEEAAAPHAKRRARIFVRIDGAVAWDSEGLATTGSRGGAQPAVARRPEFIHGVRNLVQNAVDFAGSTVWIDVELGPREVAIAIGDDGAGFDESILAELGEPFATTRGGGRGGGEADDDGYEGMGLGVFVAKTLLERTGARIEFGNAPPRRERAGEVAIETERPSGAVVRAVWPRAALIAAEPPAPRAAADRRGRGRNAFGSEETAL